MWWEVSTRDFAVRGNIEPGELKKLTESLSLFFEVVERAAGMDVQRTAVPTVCYVLRGSSFRSLDISKHAAGMTYDMGGNENLLVLGDAALLYYTREVLFHEFTHLILNNRPGMFFPAWYEEGLAEALSSMDLRGHTLTLGTPTGLAQSFLNRSDWIPMQDFLRVPSTAMLGEGVSGTFYGQAWLFVRSAKLLDGRWDGRDGDRLAALLASLQAGTRPLAAAEQAFGMKIAELDELMQRSHAQLAGGMVPLETLDARDFAPAPVTEPRVVDRAAVAIDLGRMSTTDRSLFAWVPSTSPHYAEARGHLATREALGQAWGRVDAAIAESRGAITPDRGPAELAIGYAEMIRASDEELDLELRIAAVKRARAAFRASHLADPTLPGARVALGLSFADEALGGEAAEGWQALLDAYPRVQPNAEQEVVVGLVAWRVGEKDAAVQHWRRALAFAPVSRAGDLARERLREAGEGASARPVDEVVPAQP